MRRGGAIEIALWLDLSEHLREIPAAQQDALLCYTLAIHQDPKLGVCVADEYLRSFPKTPFLRPALDNSDGSAFQQAPPMFDFSAAKQPKIKIKKLLAKTSNNTYFYGRETGSYQDSFNFGLDKLALALTPPDTTRYPTANAVKQFLLRGIRYVQLDSPAMRLPCPATQPATLSLDGTNLPRVVGQLLRQELPQEPRMTADTDSHWASPDSRVGRWVDHIRYALPDLVNIGWSKRQADNAEYLVLQYKNGLVAPSWVLSDGTLRMLALTLPAFLPDEPAIYMVEEPENGVHPKVLEIILRSLSTIPSAQMLIATHSPFVVQQCGVEPLLCFRSDEDGTHITLGAENPIFETWDGTPGLDIIFAAGVLE